MTNLGALIANENGIESLHHCKGLRQLNTIVLSSNQIEELGEEDLQGCAALGKLSLSHNRIRKIGGVFLKDCTALKELRLAHNRQGGLHSSTFPAHLKHLVLYYAGCYRVSMSKECLR